VTSVLEDNYNLVQWQLRQVAYGVSLRKDLQLAAIGHHDDRDFMKDLIETAMDAAGASEKRNLGTAIHKLCDMYDSGQEPFVPEEYLPDVQEYLRLTSSFVVEASELFSVADEIKVAGTPDRVVRLTQDMITSSGDVLPAGTLLIADIKTGSTLDFSHLSISGQLAVYARSQRYELSPDRTITHKGAELPAGDRIDWVPGERLNTKWGLVIHLPAGEGTGSLHWINLTVGWAMAQKAMELREIRKTKNLISGPILPPEEDFAAAAARAASLTALAGVAARAMVAGAWGDDLRPAFTQRREELEAAA
jgi:hypothetical protein